VYLKATPLPPAPGLGLEARGWGLEAGGPRLEAGGLSLEAKGSRIEARGWAGWVGRAGSRVLSPRKFFFRMWHCSGEPEFHFTM